MLTVIFAVTTVICGAGWFVTDGALKGMLDYAKDKECIPTKEETRKYVERALGRKLHITIE